MILTIGPEDTTAVELRTGAFVRLRAEHPAAPAGRPGTVDPADGSAAAQGGALPRASTDREPPAQRRATGPGTSSAQPVQLTGDEEPTVNAAPPPLTEGNLDAQGLLPFDVVDVAWAEDPQRDDLAQPEAVSVAGRPALVGRLRGRRARRLLRGLVAPPAQHLLGFAGTAAPYWEFNSMRPSVALVVPTRGPLLFRRRGDDSVWTRFGWPRIDQWLPVEDEHAVAGLAASGRDRLAGRSLASALGFRPYYLLVAVSRPRQGHCYKTVTALIPRP